MAKESTVQPLKEIVQIGQVTIEEREPFRFVAAGDATNYAREWMKEDDNEKDMLIIFCLDKHQQVTAVHRTVVANVEGPKITTRDVFKSAILNNANAIMTFRNKGKGKTTPTIKDLNLVKKLQQTGDLLGIKLLDSILVSTKSYTSFFEKDLL